MTRHDPDSTTIQLALELLTSHGLEDLSGALQLLINEAMKIERADYLGAGPYERSEERRGHANGFKPKSVKTRVGTLDLAIPQVRERDERGERFYPAALERGLRSERHRAESLPRFGFEYFLASLEQGFVANPARIQGDLCLGGSIGRFVGPGQVQNSGSDGVINLDVDPSALPQPLGPVAARAGKTWSFQVWFRDANPQVTSNSSNSVTVSSY